MKIRKQWKVAMLVRMRTGMVWCRNPESTPPHWKLLCGGGELKDYDWEETAKRELREKTGLNAKEIVLIEKITANTQVLYVCEPIIPEEEFRWFRPAHQGGIEIRIIVPDEMVRMRTDFFPPHRQILERNGRWPNTDKQ